MKLRMAILGALMCLLMVPAISRAQDQAKNSNDKQIAHLRVDIVLTEYDGDKKISTLPYTLYAAAPPQQGPASLRMGVRVPVATGSSGGYTYMDVGTDIDCFARSFEAGSYALHINVHRSSIYTAGQGEAGDEQIHAQPQTPVVRNFDSNSDISLHDGETKEGTSATDPLNGHVLKISITLHVQK